MNIRPGRAILRLFLTLCLEKAQAKNHILEFPMGVIRKKTISRGTEGGLKYICDICSADITATVCLSSSGLCASIIAPQN